MRSAAASGRWRGAAAARGVAVGRDGRDPLAMLEEALVRGLTESGVDVVRVGLGPTPMLYYAAPSSTSTAASMITGSHNPADYNGFKMVLKRPRLLRRGHPGAGPDGGGGRLGARAAARSRRSTSRPLCRAAAPGLSTAAPSGSAGTPATAPPGPALEKLVDAAAGRASSALHRGRRPLPQPPSRPDRRKPTSPI